MNLLGLRLFAAAPLLLVAAPSTASTALPVRLGPTVMAHPMASRSIGLGKVLTTADGGQIFGFDINQVGRDGVLATAQTVGPSDYLVSMETFDQDDGKISKVFAQYRGPRDSYTVHGIFAGDVGLITHFMNSTNNSGAYRDYDVMNPVTAENFTSKWTPPIKDLDVVMNAENQTTSTSVLFAIELKNHDQPDLIVSSIAANTFSNVIHLDGNLFAGDDSPQLAQYAAANQAVIALSPDGGRVAGAAPINVGIDLKTDKQVRFTGYNNGPYGAGTVAGLAVDPNTGIAATTTVLNAQVEFYDLAKRTGIAAVQLPCSNDTAELLSGTSVTVDSLNKLFLVTEQYYCGTNQGSAVVVYDERGTLIETITGFRLRDGNVAFAANEPPVAISPRKRMGWAIIGPKFNQLQQFFY